MTILLVTNSYDVAADYVTAVLDKLGTAYFRLDTDRFPQYVQASFDPARGSTLRSGTSSILEREITAVWYRRHSTPDLPNGIERGEADFCRRESRALLIGMLQALPTRRWMSHPIALAAAEAKPYQLSVARRLGFRLPPTLVTNDPARVERFAARRSLVVKAVSSGYIASEDGNRAVFTSRLRKKDLKDLSALSLAPVIFQELVNKRADIRVTVVGGKVFAAEIFSQQRKSSRTDWRATDDPNLGHARHELPARLSDKCVALVRALGLTFGAINLAITHDGMYTFFEINPNGEWAWIEDHLGYPISRANSGLVEGWETKLTAWSLRNYRRDHGRRLAG